MRAPNVLPFNMTAHLWQGSTPFVHYVIFSWCNNLSHQIVVPLAFDNDVCSRTKINSFDQIVVHIGVDPGLQELIERRTGRSAANKPGFKIALWDVVELARFPD